MVGASRAIWRSCSALRASGVRQRPGAHPSFQGPREHLCRYTCAPDLDRPRLGEDRYAGDTEPRALQSDPPARWWRTSPVSLVTWGQNVCRPLYPRCEACVPAPFLRGASAWRNGDPARAFFAHPPRCNADATSATRKCDHETRRHEDHEEECSDGQTKEKSSSCFRVLRGKAAQRSTGPHGKLPQTTYRREVEFQRFVACAALRRLSSPLPQIRETVLQFRRVSAVDRSPSCCLNHRSHSRPIRGEVIGSV